MYFSFNFTRYSIQLEIVRGEQGSVQQIDFKMYVKVR